ncbi:MAG: lysophospholipid acyltransferase family protein, partial [Deltaproteobacteria bacterium]
MIWLLKMLSFFLGFIPAKVSHFFSRALGQFVYRTIKFRRDIVTENLQIAFDKEKGDEEIHAIAQKNYEHYAQNLFEILNSINWSKRDYLNHTALQGIENIRSLLEQKKGGVFLGTHLGNWEFAVATAAAHGIPVDVIVKESKNKQGQKFLDWYRNRFGIGVFFESKTVSEIFESIGSGRFVVFILDQFMGPPIGVPVEFFGRPAGTAAGLALFCEKRDIPVFPAYNYRDIQGRLCTVIEPQLDYGKLPETRSERIYHRTHIYNKAMESMIRKHPEQWLWIHRRWKEFKGKSRWEKRLSGLVGLVLTIFLMSACASKAPTPTGIALPPDPTIVAPTLEAALPGEEEIEQPQMPIQKPKEPSKTAVKKANKKAQNKKEETTKTIPEENKSSFHVIPSHKI